MKHETVTVHYTCDLCRGEMDGPTEAARVTHSYSGDSVNYIVFRVYAYVPYMTSEGDVCKECMVKAMKDYVKQYEWEQERDRLIKGTNS